MLCTDAISHGFWCLHTGIKGSLDTMSVGTSYKTSSMPACFRLLLTSRLYHLLTMGVGGVLKGLDR